jgi:transposase InsO family protein
MKVELASLGSKVSRITVAKYMNQLGFEVNWQKKFKVTTNSKHNHLIIPNVLNREFSVTEPLKVWVSDITYIRVKKDSCI